MDEVLDVNLMEESFDDPAVDDETEEDELADAGMHVEGEDDEDEVPLESETE